MRSAVKRALETALCGLGVARLGRRYRTSQTLILAYHNIVPTGERAVGDLSLHLPQRQFGLQLDRLQRTHDVIALDQLDAAAQGRRPRAVITFDDAYTGAISAGMHELRERSLPATVFVAPAFINGGTFWWDVLSSADGLGLEPGLREHALHKLAGRDHAVRAYAASRHLPANSVPAHQTAASESDLTKAGGTGLITFGSHSWQHANLSMLDEQELREEILRPLEWLRSRVATIAWLSYPYGLRSQQVETAARELGFDGALLISGGWYRNRTSHGRYAIPRRNIPAGISQRGFELLISGF